MQRAQPEDVALLAGAFEGPAEFLRAEPLGHGHIHDTFRATWRGAGGEVHRVHQRINEDVFPDVDVVMTNIARVTAHLRAKVAARGGDPDREALHVVPTRDGAPYWRDAQGRPWRTYLYVEGTRTHERATRPEVATGAGRAFARFQADLADLPGEPLAETLPGFHDTPRRLARLRRVAAEDPAGRAGAAARALEELEEQAEVAPWLAEPLAAGRLPRRVCHGDTKLNNVLFDAATGAPLCVLDLDTVMPDTPLHDFGDAVRIAAATGAEDAADPEALDLDLEVFRAYATGYLAEARAFLLPAERELLAVSGRVITVELAARFLTDFLEGDRYFKVDDPEHNLVRARAQLGLARAMARRHEAMQAAIEEALAAPA